MASTTKSAECLSLETALADLFKQLERSEKRLNREEDDYLQTTMLHQTPPFGSLISGWEGILEGTKVDVHRGKERIYTQCSGTWLKFQEELQARREKANNSEAALGQGGAGGGGGDGGGGGKDAMRKNKKAKLHSRALE